MQSSISNLVVSKVDPVNVGQQLQVLAERVDGLHAEAQRLQVQLVRVFHFVALQHLFLEESGAVYADRLSDVACSRIVDLIVELLAFKYLGDFLEELLLLLCGRQYFFFHDW